MAIILTFVSIHIYKKKNEEKQLKTFVSICKILNATPNICTIQLYTNNTKNRGKKTKMFERRCLCLLAQKRLQIQMIAVFLVSHGDNEYLYKM